MPTNYKKVFIEESEEELLQMTRDEVTLHLNDKQKLFCEHYAANHNAVLAVKKAGYATRSAPSLSWKLRQQPDCHRYICWLQARTSKELHISAMDIVDHYARIAFADITDFVEIKSGRLKLIDGAQMDGQLVRSVKQGKDGITVELIDKLQALQKLERYFDIMPSDWRQRIEEKKLDILQQKLELERLKAGHLIDESEDDGFIAALKESAVEVWEDDDGDY